MLLQPIKLVRDRVNRRDRPGGMTVTIELSDPNVEFLEQFSHPLK